MPNRIIKDSIRTSDKVNALTDFQFRLWVSLIVSVDDYGRGDARPAVIKGSCFPLRNVSAKEIEKALNALNAAGCIEFYTVEGRPYFYFPKWGEHQRIRNSRGKYPPPEANNDNSRTFDSNSPRIAALIQSNPIQSESESISESELFNRFWCAYPKKANKSDAKSAFSDLYKERNGNVNFLFTAIETQKQSIEWLKEGGRFIPYPAKWLRSGAWENVFRENLTDDDPSLITETIRRLTEAM